jgi:hypothetical protein
VAEDPEKHKNGNDEDASAKAEEAENERPTVSPPFDPVAFAKDVLKPSPAQGTRAQRPTQKIDASTVKPPVPSHESQNPHTKVTPPRGVRPPAPTLSDPGEIEDARQLSMKGSGPPRRVTPASTISLANARIPSNLPPTAKDDPQKYESISGMNAVDREWAELEVSTRPPPAGENPEDVVLPSGTTDLPNLDEADDVGAPPRKPAPSDPVIEIVESTEALEPVTEEEMHDRVALGDYSGALEIAEKLLEEDPDNAAANTCAENCRGVLKQMYSARIGPLDRVPLVMVPRDQLRWLSIDHRAGFVLSLVDGVSSLEMILDVSGMPELDALRILSELAQQRIIRFR